MQTLRSLFKEISLNNNRWSYDNNTNFGRTHFDEQFIEAWEIINVQRKYHK